MISAKLLYFFFAIPDWARFMPILACSIVLGAIIIERSIFFRRIFFRLYDQAEAVFVLAESGKRSEASKLARSGGNMIMGVLADYYEKNPVRDNEAYLQLLAERCQRKIEKYMGAVSTIATISPMLGLLGTVSGIMHSFGGLAVSGASGQDMLAMGIAEALLTTAFGLIVAIPALIYYNYMVSRSALLIQELELLSNRVVGSGDEKDKA